MTNVREVAVLCATVGELIRKVFGSYTRFETFAKDNNKRVGRTLTTKLGRPVLPLFHEIETVVECCELAEPNLLQGTVLSDLKQLHDDAVRAQEAKKTGTLQRADVDSPTSGDSTVVEIVRDLVATNRQLTEDLHWERQHRTRSPEAPTVEAVVAPEGDAPTLVDEATLQRLRFLPEHESVGSAGWDLRLIVLPMLFAAAAGGVVWLGWPVWAVVVASVVALGLFSWSIYRVMTTSLVQHLVSAPSAAATARPLRTVWWLAEDEKCLAVLQPRPASRCSTALHRWIHGDAHPATTTFTGRLRVPRVAGLRPDRIGSTYTAVDWKLIDLDSGHVLGEGTLWSENGPSRVAKFAVTVAGHCRVGLTLTAGCPTKITLARGRFGAGIPYPQWWRGALLNHTQHAHHRLRRQRTAALDRRRPDLPPAEERQYSTALRDIRRQVRGMTELTAPARRRWWQRR
ncbi:hypothetical protein ACFWMR_07300 [Amycolatopsis thailandensis]|uniref:hypothetical protein n=1 Tax=Amycolatopsis thailandensis TaxID=589330 RepID=UPI0036644708